MANLRVSSINLVYELAYSKSVSVCNSVFNQTLDIDLQKLKDQNYVNLCWLAAVLPGVFFFRNVSFSLSLFSKLWGARVSYQSTCCVSVLLRECVCV